MWFEESSERHRAFKTPWSVQKDHLHQRLARVVAKVLGPAAAHSHGRKTMNTSKRPETTTVRALALILSTTLVAVSACDAPELEDDLSGIDDDQVLVDEHELAPLDREPSSEEVAAVVLPPDSAEVGSFENDAGEASSLCVVVPCPMSNTGPGSTDPEIGSSLSSNPGPMNGSGGCYCCMRFDGTVIQTGPECEDSCGYTCHDGDASRPSVESTHLDARSLDRYLEQADLWGDGTEPGGDSVPREHRTEVRR